MEGDRVYYTDQNLVNPGLDPHDASNNDFVIAENKFMHFIRECQVRGTYIYREQLKANAQRGKYFLKIEMEHLHAFDDPLVTMFRAQPNDYLKVFEAAIATIYSNDLYDETNPDLESNPKFQVQIHSDENPMMLRDLQSNMVGKVICVPGIITSTSKTACRASKATFKCKNCGHMKTLEVQMGLTRVIAPGICENQKAPGANKTNCPLNSYEMDTDNCDFIDQQILKLQEAPELIPTGEMPRTVLMTSDRCLTDICTPGNRVKIVGILSITKTNSSSDATSTKGVSTTVQKSYIKVLGIQSCMNEDGSASSMGFSMPTITEEDKEKFENLKRDPELYEKIAKSVAPSIFGHPDIKKAIACLLFGGCAKQLPDKMKLRGDINVLLLGDPSVAKSQFLKFVDRCAPICVYTSGKGSSAAGLTASVIKDASTGEFQLEGGAMVLADGGVVCIDEFDKMRPQDRVAIHEAMEQQTISIAKAGITTILNSRVSVLAAANPVFGRYDDLKAATEQMDFQASILSRFDTIFIVRDIREDGLDKSIAHHVLNLHMHAKQDESTAEFSIELMRKFCCYAKSKVQPKLSEEACHMLQNMYVSDRQNSKDQRVSKKTNGIPITVRQLEAIIRLSEAIAKMHLETVVNPRHVEEAHRIFKISTLNAASSGMQAGSGESPSELVPMIRKIEEAIKRRVAIGTKIPYIKLQQEMMLRFDNQRAIDYAIISMVKSGDFQHQEGRKLLYRQFGQRA